MSRAFLSNGIPFEILLGIYTHFYSLLKCNANQARLPATVYIPLLLLPEKEKKREVFFPRRQHLNGMPFRVEKICKSGNKVWRRLRPATIIPFRVKRIRRLLPERKTPTHTGERGKRHVFPAKHVRSVGKKSTIELRKYTRRLRFRGKLSRRENTPFHNRPVRMMRDFWPNFNPPLTLLMCIVEVGF